MRVASGDGVAGSMMRSQLRTTSAARKGEPSLNVRSGRMWKMTRRPPSSIRHDSARAGRSSSVSSKVVNVSKNWAITAALPASPVAAGSRLVGSPRPIRAVPSLSAAGAWEQALASNTPASRATSKAVRRSIGRSIRVIPAGPLERDWPSRRARARRARDEASQAHTAGGTMLCPRGLCCDNDSASRSLGPVRRDSWIRGSAGRC